MPTASCLVADPAAGLLTDALLRDVEGALQAGRQWLAPERAVEFIARELTPVEGAARLHPLLAGLPIDWCCLPTEGRRKRLLLADMDSTMITVECIDELAAALNIRSEVAAITARAMNGEIDFAEALRHRVSLLKGLPVREIERICEERVVASPGAAQLVATMRRHGARAVLVSGGFAPFTRHVRRLLGFDRDESNGLEMVDGRLTGRLQGALRDAGSKLQALRRHAIELGVDLAGTMAIGDGANDLPMLRAAGLGIAYRAHSRVRELIPCQINHTDLATALFFQGYPAEAFVSPAGAPG